jgi:DNA-binding MarR family transcriptional regulator
MVDLPRWLTDDDRHTWLAFLYAQTLLLEQIEQDLQRDAGMPLAYYQILVILSEHPGGALRMSELASAAFFSRSRLSHAIDRMEKSGWIRREACPSDRRGSIAALTDAGRRVLEEAAPGHVESVRRHLFDQLSDREASELRDVCEKLVRYLLRSLNVSAPSVLPNDYFGVQPGDSLNDARSLP